MKGEDVFTLLFTLAVVAAIVYLLVRIGKLGDQVAVLRRDLEETKSWVRATIAGALPANLQKRQGSVYRLGEGP